MSSTLQYEVLVHILGKQRYLKVYFNDQGGPTSEDQYHFDVGTYPETPNPIEIRTFNRLVSGNGILQKAAHNAIRSARSRAKNAQNKNMSKIALGRIPK